MNDGKFRVVFKGDILAGAQLDEVTARLGKLDVKP